MRSQYILFIFLMAFSAHAATCGSRLQRKLPAFLKMAAAEREAVLREAEPLPPGDISTLAVVSAGIGVTAAREGLRVPQYLGMLPQAESRRWLYVLQGLRTNLHSEEAKNIFDWIVAEQEVPALESGLAKILLRNAL